MTMNDNSEVSELQRLANDKRNYGTDRNQITYEEEMKKALYSRLRVFADGRDPQLYKVV